MDKQSISVAVAFVAVLLFCGCGGVGSPGAGGGSATGGGGGSATGGGSGTGGGVSTGGGTATGGGTTACTTVCFTEGARVATPPPALGAPAFPNVTDCNVGGVNAPGCPSGYSCTGQQTVDVGNGQSYTRAVCVPSSTAASSIVFALPAPPPGGQGVAVTMEFRLNGQPWPSSTPAGAAGTLSLREKTTGQSSTLLVPTSSAPLLVSLPTGEYDLTLSLQGANFDYSKYPSQTHTGTLKVGASGTVSFEILGSLITKSLSIGGAPLPTLTTSDLASLTFRGGHGQYVSFKPDFSSPFWLEPDDYQVELNVSASSNQAVLPVGRVVLAQAFSVPDTNSRTGSWNAPLAVVSGSVQVDGADLPSTVSATVLVGSSSVVVPSSRPAQYSARVFPGVYNINLTTVSSVATVPSATVQLFSNTSVTANATLNLAARTAVMSGTLQINGQAGSATLQLVPPGAYTGQVISTTGTWSQRVFLGQYDVLATIPSSTPTAVLESGFNISAAVSRAYNISLVPLSLTILNGSSQPVDGTTLRGMFGLVFQGHSTSILAPATGSLTISTLVMPGTWSATFTAMGSYLGIPTGRVDFGPIAVASSIGATVTKSVVASTLSIELRLNGQTLSPPAAGKTRGSILVVGAGSSAQVLVPNSGPASVGIPVVPGDYWLYLSCDATCDTVPGPGISLGGPFRVP